MSSANNAGGASTAEKVVRHMPDMVFTISSEGRYTGFLPGSSIEPVVPPDQFMGRTLDEVVGESIAAQTKTHISRALATGQVQSFCYWLEDRAGIRLFEARLTPSGSEEVIVMVRDLTEEGSDERSIREALEACRAALELAAPFLPRDSAADRAAANALGRAYRLGDSNVEYGNEGGRQRRK